MSALNTKFIDLFEFSFKKNEEISYAIHNIHFGLVFNEIAANFFRLIYCLNLELGVFKVSNATELFWIKIKLSKESEAQPKIIIIESFNYIDRIS